MFQGFLIAESILNFKIGKVFLKKVFDLKKCSWYINKAIEKRLFKKFK